MESPSTESLPEFEDSSNDSDSLGGLTYLFQVTLTAEDMINLTFRATEQSLAFLEGLPQDCINAIANDELEVFFVSPTGSGDVGLAGNHVTGEIKFLWREENFISSVFDVGDIINVWCYYDARKDKYGFAVIRSDDDAAAGGGGGGDFDDDDDYKSNGNSNQIAPT